MNISVNNEKYFSSEVLNFIRSSFCYLEQDPLKNERLYFENSGGSLRLKEVIAEDAKYAAYPDSSARNHEIAKLLKEKSEEGIKDIRLLLNAKDGTIAPFHTASKAMFEIIRVINENTDGNNIVTTAIDHPSSFDACQIYGKATGKEVRVAYPNPETGAVEAKSISTLIDKNTSLLSIILTSNISGSVLDIEKIIEEARKVNPDIYIVLDAVQYAPHGLIDVERWKVDALNIAPYKMFGNRGIGFAYLSNRVASLPHSQLLDKDENNWTVGSISPALYAGFSKIINYICTIGSFYRATENRRDLFIEGMNRIKAHEQALLNQLIYGSEKELGIKDIEGVTVHFTKQEMDEKDLILALTFDNIDSSDAVNKYSEENIIVYERSNNNIFSKRILESLNLDSIVRVSPLHCHTSVEIDRFLQVTRKIASN